MDVAVDSSTLISLAWSGRLELLERFPLTLVVPAEVRQETVTEGIARGYPDAAAIDSAIKRLRTMAAESADVVDDAVLRVAQTVGGMLSNDLALGRRAANLGVTWLRTADLVMVCVRAGGLAPDHGLASLEALHDAGRITDEQLDAYREELT